MIKVGIVGCGAIGSYLVKNILTKYKNQIKLIGACDIDAQRVVFMGRSLNKKITSLSLDNLVKRADLVIEAAGVEVVEPVIKKAMHFRKDVMIMSVGGLLKNPSLIKKAIGKKIKLYIPSGAIAGLDALKAGRMGKIKKVTLTTKKPLRGLSGAQYLRDNKISLNKIKKDKIIFRGTAEQAVLGFPRNINVAAVLSLAGIGAKKTNVIIVASPIIKRNIHTLEIEGDFGRILCCTENVPSEQNPKTSQLAMFSAMAVLDGILNNVRMGN